MECRWVGLVDERLSEGKDTESFAYAKARESSSALWIIKSYTSSSCMVGYKEGGLSGVGEDSRTGLTFRRIRREENMEIKGQ